MESYFCMLIMYVFGNDRSMNVLLFLVKKMNLTDDKFLFVYVEIVTSYWR